MPTLQNYHNKTRAFVSTLGVECTRIELFQEAFVHRSALNEHRGMFADHNERLEFLGDAVLELAVTRMLFENYPDKDEGWMTDVRSSLVRGKQLGTLARKLGFGEQLILSRGEKATKGHENIALLANAFEAFLGALYLDSGFDRAYEFIRAHVFVYIDEVVHQQLYIDPKSHLQEIIQAHDGTLPEYTVYEERGADHEKEFVVHVAIHGIRVGMGAGTSKKKAQENAAADALAKQGEWLKQIPKRQEV